MTHIGEKLALGTTSRFSRGTRPVDLGDLAFQLVVRGVESLGHLIELLCQSTNLGLGLDDHVVREVTAPELYHPFAELDDGSGKALAQDVGNAHTDQQTNDGEAASVP